MTGHRRRLAMEVVERLRERGHLSLWAGGCVRDLLLGEEPSDYDVATDATPEQVMRIFRRTVPVGVSFGVVRVLGSPASNEVEVATFRSDEAYVDGRRPTAVTFSSPEIDASRRDFTINGLFFDPLAERVIDYVGGQADLEARVLRAIGDPASRFGEDKLRLLRAVRFASRFGLRIEPATQRAIEAMAPQVRVVAPERIAQELRKILVDRRRSTALELARTTGLLGPILPDVARLATPAEGSAWPRTLKVLEALGERPSFPLALASLFVDVGSDATGTAAGSAAIAAQRVDAVGRELRLSNPEREHTAWLVAHQHALVDAPALPRHRLKRLLAAREAGDLIALRRAIETATTGASPDATFAQWYREEPPDGPLDPPPLIDGRDLLARGLAPGPEIAARLADVRDAQLDGLVSDRESALALVDRLIAAKACQ